MRQAHTRIIVPTRGQNLYEFTHKAERFVGETEFASGLATLFCQHTSCSLTIQENADPDVRTDLLRFLKRLVREDPQDYVHTLEGPDDMPAHIRSMLTDVSLSIPIIEGRLGLGTWQGIYLFEHRAAAHERQILMHVMGE